MDLINIKKNENLEVSKNVYNYLNPDYIYIPYFEKHNINVKNNETIFKDSIILNQDDKYIYSSVSGVVLGVAQMVVEHKKMPVIVIENDFKEKVKKIKGVKKYLNDYSKTELIEIIKLFNAYSDNLEGKMLVINGLDYEVYEKTRSTIIKRYTNELLETIDALYGILDCKKCFLAIKNNDSDNVEGLIHHIGTYPNIDLKMMPDLYPLAHKDILLKELVMPANAELGVIYFTIEDIFKIYNVLKRQRPITEKLITISGNMVETPKVINVKIGSSLKDIINNNFKLKGNNYKIIVNGLLSGYEVESLDLIITADIRSVFLNTLSDASVRNCINCGMCHTKCPVGCDPRTNYKMNECINCGVCTYICPVNINFKKGDK